MHKETLGIYDSPLPSYRSGIFYNTFPYPTKITPESIAVFIATHTDPGATVLDAFSGSGSTGLAALMCENPTEDMISLAKSMGVTPKWGKRNAILYDISVYGTFASSVMAEAPDHLEFEAMAHYVLDKAEDILEKPYSTHGPDGEEGEIRHVIWSSVLICPSCGNDYTFVDGMVTKDPLRINSIGTCPHCGTQVTADKDSFAKDEHWDSWIGEEASTRKRVPALIYGESHGENWCRPADYRDALDMARFDSAKLPSSAPIEKIKWGELHRSGYHDGIQYLHQFYTTRNYLVFSTLWDLVNNLEDCNDETKNALKLWLLSYNQTHSTLMTRVVAKKNSKDFVLSGAQSGVLYISNLPVEKNIFKGLRRKIRNFTNAFNYLSDCSGKIYIRNTSSTHMDESSDSIDYVFTDPPFGDFIPYSEVNQINELWLGKVTETSEEAIISPSQNKHLTEYAGFIESSLREMLRVLKTGACATVVYHASKAAVWNAFADAVSQSGFTLIKASYLDKKQQSFKQIVSSGSVRNDSLLLLTKLGASESAPTADSTMDEREAESVQLAYTRYVNNKLINGEEVVLDADKAYEVLGSHGRSAR